MHAGSDTVLRAYQVARSGHHSAPILAATHDRYWRGRHILPAELTGSRSSPSLSTTSTCRQHTASPMGGTRSEREILSVYWLPPAGRVPHCPDRVDQSLASQPTSSTEAGRGPWSDRRPDAKPEMQITIYYTRGPGGCLGRVPPEALGNGGRFDSRVGKPGVGASGSRTAWSHRFVSDPSTDHSEPG